MIKTWYYRWIWGILAGWHLAITCLMPLLHHCDLITHCSHVCMITDNDMGPGEALEADSTPSNQDETGLQFCLACVFQTQCKFLQGPILDMSSELGDCSGYQAEAQDQSLLIQHHWQSCIARRGPPTLL